MSLKNYRKDDEPEARLEERLEGGTSHLPAEPNFLRGFLHLQLISGEALPAASDVDRRRPSRLLILNFRFSFRETVRKTSTEVLLSVGFSKPNMAKGKTVLIRLMSHAGTGYFYVKRKNPKTMLHKLELMKYDPIVNKHVLFSEQKFKK